MAEQVVQAADVIWRQQPQCLQRSGSVGRETRLALGADPNVCACADEMDRALGFTGQEGDAIASREGAGDAFRRDRHGVIGGYAQQGTGPAWVRRRVSRSRRRIVPWQERRSMMRVWGVERARHDRVTPADACA